MQFRINSILLATFLLALCLGLARWFRYLPEVAHVIVGVLLLGLAVCGFGMMVVAFLFALGIMLTEYDAHRNDNFRQCIALLAVGIVATIPSIVFAIGMFFGH